eukprot:1158311-Pelagomonas_calceolata.AAC.9
MDAILPPIGLCSMSSSSSSLRSSPHKQINRINDNMTTGHHLVDHGHVLNVIWLPWWAQHHSMYLMGTASFNVPDGHHLVAHGDVLDVIIILIVIFVLRIADLWEALVV